MTPLEVLLAVIVGLQWPVLGWLCNAAVKMRESLARVEVKLEELPCKKTTALCKPS